LNRKVIITFKPNPDDPGSMFLFLESLRDFLMDQRTHKYILEFSIALEIPPLEIWKKEHEKRDEV